MTFIGAHLGHWYVGGPIYAAPVVAIFLWLRWVTWREKRRGRGHEKDQDMPPESSPTRR